MALLPTNFCTRTRWHRTLRPPRYFVRSTETTETTTSTSGPAFSVSRLPGQYVCLWFSESCKQTRRLINAEWAKLNHLPYSVTVSTFSDAVLSYIGSNMGINNSRMTEWIDANIILTLSSNSTNMQENPSTVSPTLTSRKCFDNWFHTSINLLAPKLNPSRSFTCVIAITMAAAEVKPAETGPEIKSTRKPGKPKTTYAN